MPRAFHPIRKRGSQWVVIARSDGRTLGTHKTYRAALEQLRAIEYRTHGRNPRERTRGMEWDVCECEHIDHFPDEDTGELVGPHAYQQEVKGVLLTQTTYGKFRLCEFCRNEHLAGFIEE